MEDNYDYSLDKYVSPDKDERLRQIEMAKAQREEKMRIQVAQMFLQDLIEVILQVGAQTGDTEEKFAKMIE